PGLRRLAIMVNVSYPAAKKELAECQAACRTLGLEATVLELTGSDDIVPAFGSLHGGAEGLYVVAEALVDAHRARIAALALDAHLPTMFGATHMAESGGLMAYGPSLSALFRRAAEYVDKILRGTKPGDIPVEQPTKFDLVINLKIAKALDITIPPT